MSAEKTEGPNGPDPRVERRESVVIRFCGDSGDGMQLTGTEFTHAAALYGNDVATSPDIPAEIRAPAGSLAGVSGFQLQFSSSNIYTAGDAPDVMVAMNPAALRTNLSALSRGGLLIVDVGAFKAKNLELAQYEKNPLDDGTLEGYRVIPIDITKQVNNALKGTGRSPKDISRTRNMFALGICFWMYGRDAEREVGAIRAKFESHTRTRRKLWSSSPTFRCSGFRYRRCRWLTSSPSARSSWVAWRRAPKVLPQPTSSSPPSGLP